MPAAVAGGGIDGHGATDADIAGASSERGPAEGEAGKSRLAPSVILQAIVVVERAADDTVALVAAPRALTFLALALCAPSTATVGTSSALLPSCVLRFLCLPLLSRP